MYVFSNKTCLIQTSIVESCRTIVIYRKVVNGKTFNCFFSGAKQSLTIGKVSGNVKVHPGSITTLSDRYYQ
jgi:hypothetical protein